MKLLRMTLAVLAALVLLSSSAPAAYNKSRVSPWSKRIQCAPRKAKRAARVRRVAHAKKKMEARRAAMRAVPRVVRAAKAPCPMPAAERAAEMPSRPSMPALFGAGRTPIAYAANIDKSAWITTTDLACPTPTQVAGWIQMSVLDASPTDSAESSDRADMVSQFGYNGANYKVRYTCLNPVGESYSHFGGVGLLKPIFGTTGIGPTELPRTLAYIVTFGSSKITKDGETVAERAPSMALVTQAIHDPSHKIMAESDPSAQEIHLIVPGSMQEGGTAVPGFPNGYFYIYWPSAALDLRNIGGTVHLTEISEVVVPEGPRVRVKGVVQETGVRPLRITLTEKGIDKSLARSTAGLYDVTITNESRRHMGIFMNGNDVCCTEFNRFTNVLAPGKHQKFRFYFASGKVMFRELLSCTRRERTCAVATYGPHSTSITFE